MCCHVRLVGSQAARHYAHSACVLVGVAASYIVGLAGLAIVASVVAPPQPRYVPETSWVELHVVESAEITVPIAIVFLFAMAASVIIDKLRGRRSDLCLYPLRQRVGAIVGHARPRAVLVMGFAIIAGYVVIACIAPRLFGAICQGVFWPADVVLLGLLGSWAAVWLAEALVPPVRTSAVAALILLASSLSLGCCAALRPSLLIVQSLPARSISDVVYLVACAVETRNVPSVPRFATETRETEHFIYHYAKGDTPLIASLEAQEQHYAFVKTIFGIELPPKMNFMKYPDFKTFAEVWPGDGGRGGRDCIQSTFWFHPHEAVHSYLLTRNTFLAEGIAEAFGTTFFQGWCDFRDSPVPTDVQSLRKAMDHMLGQSSEARGISCNFLRWLYLRYGSEKLLALLRDAYLEGSRTRAVMTRVYGMPFEDLAARWQRDQQWLNEQLPPEGFFLYPPWDKEVRADD